MYLFSWYVTFLHRGQYQSLANFLNHVWWHLRQVTNVIITARSPQLQGATLDLVLDTMCTNPTTPCNQDTQINMRMYWSMQDYTQYKYWDWSECSYQPFITNQEQSTIFPEVLCKIPCYFITSADRTIRPLRMWADSEMSAFKTSIETDICFHNDLSLPTRRIPWSSPR